MSFTSIDTKSSIRGSFIHDRFTGLATKWPNLHFEITITELRVCLKHETTLTSTLTIAGDMETI